MTQTTALVRPQQVITLIPAVKTVKKSEKALILDSGVLINLSMNGLIYMLEELKKTTNVSFFITREVMNETVGRPLNIPRFELGALMIQSLITGKTIEFPDSVGITEKELAEKTNELINIANHSIKSRDQWVKLVSEAEVSCLALSSILSSRNIENIIAIDERTTRLLAEKPENLEQLMAKKLHANVFLVGDSLKVFSRFRFIRTTELVYVAHKKGLIKIKGPKVLEALLYATKYKGSSVSFEEINEMKRL